MRGGEHESFEEDSQSLVLPFDYLPLKPPTSMEVSGIEPESDQEKLLIVERPLTPMNTLRLVSLNSNDTVTPSTRGR